MLTRYYKLVILLRKMLSFLKGGNQLCNNRYLTRLKWFSVNIAMIKKCAWLVWCTALAYSAFGQYTWKLSKEKDGIRVYQSGVEHLQL